MPAIVLVLLITSNYAQAANRICGSRLAEVLAVVCRGRGYYWEIEKRTGRCVCGVSGQGLLLGDREENRKVLVSCVGAGVTIGRSRR